MKKQSTFITCLCVCLMTACGGESQAESPSDGIQVAADTTSTAYEAAMEAVLEDGKQLKDAMKELDALFPEE